MGGAAGSAGTETGSRVCSASGVSSELILLIEGAWEEDEVVLVVEEAEDSLVGASSPRSLPLAHPARAKRAAPARAASERRTFTLRSPFEKPAPVAGRTRQETHYFHVAGTTPRDHLHLVSCCGSDLSRPPGAPGNVGDTSCVGVYRVGLNTAKADNREGYGVWHPATRCPRRLCPYSRGNKGECSSVPRRARLIGLIGPPAPWRSASGPPGLTGGDWTLTGKLREWLRGWVFQRGVEQQEWHHRGEFPAAPPKASPRLRRSGARFFCSG